MYIIPDTTLKIYRKYPHINRINYVKIVEFVTYSKINVTQRYNFSKYSENFAIIYASYKNNRRIDFRVGIKGGQSCAHRITSQENFRETSNFPLY